MTVVEVVVAAAVDTSWRIMAKIVSEVTDHLCHVDAVDVVGVDHVKVVAVAAMTWM